MHKSTDASMSEVGRKYVAQGQVERHQERRVLWFQEGLEQGIQDGRRAALIEVLEARRLPLDEATRQRILACSALPDLKRWLRKALSVKAAKNIFGRKSVARPAARKASKRGKSTKASKPRAKV